MEGVANTPYPNLRRASRTLELAYPQADVELREELAYLVSARRRTIQDALNYLADKSNVIRSSRTASPEPQEQEKELVLQASSGSATRQHEGSSSHERQFLSLPSPNKYSNFDNTKSGANNKKTSNLDYAKYTLPSHSQSQESTPSTSFAFPHHELNKHETHKANGYTLHNNVFKLPRDCAPSQNHINNNNNNNSNNNSVYKKYEGINVSFHSSNNVLDNGHVLPSIVSNGKEMIASENSNNNNSNSSENNSVIFPNIQAHSNGWRGSKHHMYTNIVNSVNNSSNKKYHYVYGDNAEKFDEEIIGEGGQVILYVTSMTGEQRVRDHCRALETLLYLKEVPYHLIDIADNALLQRRIRLIYERATHLKVTPHMPQLCVDDILIGDYEQVQEKEDNNCFVDALRDAGAKNLPAHIVLSKVESSVNMPNEEKSVNVSQTNEKEKKSYHNNNNNNNTSTIHSAMEERKTTNHVSNDINKTVSTEERNSKETNVSNNANSPNKSESGKDNLEKNENEISKISNNNNVYMNKGTGKKNNPKNTTTTIASNNNSNPNNIIVVNSGMDKVQCEVSNNNNKNKHTECNRKESVESNTPLPSSSFLVAPPASILIKRSSFTTSTPNQSASTSAFLKHAIVKSSSSSSNNNNSNTYTLNINKGSNNAALNNKSNSREIARSGNALTRVAPQLPASSTSTSTSSSSLLPQIKEREDRTNKSSFTRRW